MPAILNINDGVHRRHSAPYLSAQPTIVSSGDTEVDIPVVDTFGIYGFKDESYIPPDLTPPSRFKGTSQIYRIKQEVPEDSPPMMYFDEPTVSTTLEKRSDVKLKGTQKQSKTNEAEPVVKKEVDKLEELQRWIDEGKARAQARFNSRIPQVKIDYLKERISGLETSIEVAKTTVLLNLAEAKTKTVKERDKYINYARVYNNRREEAKSTLIKLNKYLLRFEEKLTVELPKDLGNLQFRKLPMFEIQNKPNEKWFYLGKKKEGYQFASYNTQDKKLRLHTIKEADSTNLFGVKAANELKTNKELNGFSLETKEMQKAVLVSNGDFSTSDWFVAYKGPKSSIVVTKDFYDRETPIEVKVVDSDALIICDTEKALPKVVAQKPRPIKKTVKQNSSPSLADTGFTFLGVVKKLASLFKGWF